MSEDRLDEIYEEVSVKLDEVLDLLIEASKGDKKKAFLEFAEITNDFI